MSNFALKKVLESAPTDLEYFLVTQKSTETVYIVWGTSGNADGQPEYIATAKPGTSTAAPRWKIMKITYNADANPTNIQWAGGLSSYINIADNYAGYTYS